MSASYDPLASPIDGVTLKFIELTNGIRLRVAFAGEEKGTPLTFSNPVYLVSCCMISKPILLYPIIFCSYFANKKLPYAMLIFREFFLALAIGKF